YLILRPDFLRQRAKDNKRRVVFAVGGLPPGRSCRCTVASHTRGHHAIHNRAPLRIPRLIFKAFRHSGAPFACAGGSTLGLSATDALAEPLPVMLVNLATAISVPWVSFLRRNSRDEARRIDANIAKLPER